MGWLRTEAKTGGGQRDTETHVIPSDHEDVWGTVLRLAYRVDRKAFPVKGMCRIDHLYLIDARQGCFADGGIDLAFR
jgi:hypothetical protein